jgi:predicted MFS family arabinose efflux permease
MTGERSLGSRFARLWAATAVSNLGDGVLLVGAPLLAVGLTRSPFLVSLTSTLSRLPWLVLPLVAGALADRHDRRSIIRGAALTRGAILAVAAVTSLVGWFDLPMLYLLVVVVGSAEVFADTTTQSTLPMLVRRERLGAANGRILSTQSVAADLLGAPLAGGLLAVGTAAILGGTAALFVLAAILVSTLQGSYRLESTDDTATTVAHEIAEGLRYLRRTTVLRDLALLAAVLNLAGAAYLTVFVLWAVGEASAVGLEPHEYGLLLALLGVGGAAGALVVEPLMNRLGSVALMQGAAATGGAVLVIPIAAPRIAAIAPAILAVGVASAFTSVIIVSLRQQLIPPRLLGRVNATYRLIGMGTMPLGALLAGRQRSDSAYATSCSRPRHQPSSPSR